MPLDLIATTAFGLESVAAREIEQLGYEPRVLSTGRVHFAADESGVARANIRLRTADRVLLRVGHFPAPDFDALFETTKSLAWEERLPRDAAFPVNGRSVKSQLTSVPAVQRTVKKAIVERLMSAHRVQTLPETGPRFIVEIALLENQATITLDTSGDGLHKRGYRDLVGEAALKETLAAGLVLLSVWRPHRPLIDPFCGTGTIAIEAAMIGREIAPGLTRRFDAESWPFLPAKSWSDARDEACAGVKPSLPVTIHASDTSDEALSMARRHAERAGVARDIHFQKRDFAELSSKVEHGCLIANPPYGKRLGEDEAIERLYRTFPDVLRRFPTWSHHILTARPDFERLVGQRATRRRKLFNAQIECTYYTFLGPRPPRAGGSTEESAEDTEYAVVRGEASEEEVGATSPRPSQLPGAVLSPHVPAPSPPSPPSPAPTPPAFGGLRPRDLREIDDFESRLAKRARHLRKWPERGITCYRLYERDCPDVPVVVDRYEDHAHIFEHEREHSRTLAQHLEWLDEVARRTARVLDIPFERVHVKSRPKQRGLTQHEKIAEAGATLTAREGGLKFEVNLTDYADTGLFLDHRLTRGMVRDLISGARARAERSRFLNLFCYTASFTVYAAAAGCEASTSVDLSNTYLDWARRNMRLNGLDSARHRFARSDVLEFLRAHAPGPHYEVAVVDPPTFSNSKSTDEDWEVQRGHAEVLALVLPLMSPGGTVFFSTNFRRFKLDEAALEAARPGVQVQEITARTIPEDFRNERIHRCWRLRVP